MCNGSEEVQIEKYLRFHEERVDYYERRCKLYKKLYYILMIIKVTATVAIPVFAVIDKESAGISAAVCSSIVLLLESILYMTKAKEKWTSYRSTADKLTRERRKFENQVLEYEDNENREKLFIIRCEEIMEHEETQWSQYIKSTEKDDGKTEE